MFDTMRSYKYLSHKFLSFAQQIARSPECCLLVDNTLDILAKQVEDMIVSSTTASGGQCPTHMDVQTLNESLTNARLKKKNVCTKTSRRTQTWLDKKHKGKIRIQSTAPYEVGKSKVCSLK
jgi:hypothetical protein